MAFKIVSVSYFYVLLGKHVYQGVQNPQRANSAPAPTALLAVDSSHQQLLLLQA